MKYCEYEVEGYASFPKNKDKTKPLPGLIYNRGGNRELGTINTTILCKLARVGFVVMASQYRGNCGGTVKDAIKWLKQKDIL